MLVQIYLGGLVAGLDAGMSYNTWPLMDGAVIPGDLLVIEPAWRNFFENPKTVQFVHRLRRLRRVRRGALAHDRHAPPRARHHPCAPRAGALPSGAGRRPLIGIATLVMQVPLHWALLHQGFALVVLGFAAAHWRGTKGAYPLPTEIAVRG